MPDAEENDISAPVPKAGGPVAAVSGDAAAQALKTLVAEEDGGGPSARDAETLPAIGDELGLSPLEVLPRWTGTLLLVLGALTLPWIAFLAQELPNRSRVAHEDLTWAGFDVLLCALLLRTGWSALRKREHIELTAGMTGALLIVDSWFDVTSAATRAQFGAAMAMALFVELPLAAFCLWVAGRVEFARRKRSERLTLLLRRLDRRRAERTGPSRSRSGAAAQEDRQPLV